MAYKLSDRSKLRLSGVHPNLVSLIETAIKDSPYDFGIPEFGGLRTLNDQQKLYAIGRTVEVGRKPVTFTDGVKKKSNHQAKTDGYGHAFDIYIYDNEKKKASWDIDKLEAVARHLQKVGKELGIDLKWGGDWKWKDYPHFEF